MNTDKPYKQAGWKNGRPVFMRQTIGGRNSGKTAMGYGNINVRGGIAGSYQDELGKPSCGGIRDGQEVYCPTCALRWSLDEDRPECPQ